MVSENNRVNSTSSRIIKTSGYTSQITEIEPGLYLSERIQSYSKKHIQIETFGNNWILAMADMTPGHACVRSGSQLIDIAGPTAIFIPPLALIEWHIQPGIFTWSCLSSSSIIDFSSKANPFLLQWQPQKIPQSLSETYDLLQEKNILKELIQERKKSQLAWNAKTYIANHFTDDLKISEVAQKLKCSRVVLSREFQKTYGITPINWRQQLRIFEAINLISQGHSITYSIYESGYSSPNQFIDFFKSHTLARPIDFQFKRNLINKNPIDGSSSLD